MGERLVPVLSSQLGFGGFTTSSAGTRAVINNPIHDNAAAVIRELGGDTSNFAARQVSPKILAGADLILAMTQDHRDRILELAPRKLHRTFTLQEASRLVSQFSPQDLSDLSGLRSSLAPDDARDIADPIGRDPEFFGVIGAQIAELLPPVLELCHRSATSLEH